MLHRTADRAYTMTEHDWTGLVPMKDDTDHEDSCTCCAYTGSEHHYSYTGCVRLGLKSLPSLQRWLSSRPKVTFIFNMLQQKVAVAGSLWTSSIHELYAYLLAESTSPRFYLNPYWENPLPA